MHTPVHYRERAARFREMAHGAEPEIAAMLQELATEYEALAERLELNLNRPEIPD